MFMDEVLKQFDKDTQLLVVSRRSKGQGVGNGRVLQGTVLEVGRGWKGVMRAKLGFGEARPTCNTHTHTHRHTSGLLGLQGSWTPAFAFKLCITHLLLLLDMICHSYLLTATLRAAGLQGREPLGTRMQHAAAGAPLSAGSCRHPCQQPDACMRLVVLWSVHALFPAIQSRLQNAPWEGCMHHVVHGGWLEPVLSLTLWCHA